MSFQLWKWCLVGRYGSTHLWSQLLGKLRQVEHLSRLANITRYFFLLKQYLVKHEVVQGVWRQRHIHWHSHIVGPPFFFLFLWSFIWDSVFLATPRLDLKLESSLSSPLNTEISRVHPLPHLGQSCLVTVPIFPSCFICFYGFYLVLWKF